MEVIIITGKVSHKQYFFSRSTAKKSATVIFLAIVLSIFSHSNILNVLLKPDQFPYSFLNATRIIFQMQIMTLAVIAVIFICCIILVMCYVNKDRAMLVASIREIILAKEIFYVSKMKFKNEVSSSATSAGSSARASTANTIEIEYSLEMEYKYVVSKNRLILKIVREEYNNGRILNHGVVYELDQYLSNMYHKKYKLEDNLEKNIIYIWIDDFLKSP